MRFFEKVIERENIFLKRLREEEGKLPVYVWGAGEGGRQVVCLLKEEGISYDGIVVNRQYYEEEANVLCLENLLETVDKINLIIAFKGYQKDLLAGYEDRVANVFDYDCWAGTQEGRKGDMNYISYEWLVEHEKELQEVYDSLTDDLSQRCFIAYLNQKVSMKFGYLSEVRTRYQYFDEELVQFTDKEVFVDCGAYIGDSAQAFIQALSRRGISTWEEIISFEPDPDNFSKMQALGLKNHRCVQKGVSDRQGVLYFSSKDTSGKIEESGDIKIEVDTIDHVVGDGNVTMVKMDIEGEEIRALRGAENVIKKCHPLLTICLYHYKQDLYEIPLYIKSLVPEYQFFIRTYEDTATELVLYGIYNG